MFKAVFKMSAETEADPDGLRSVGRWLMIWIRPPGGFGLWCVEQADAAASEAVADRFLEKAAVHLQESPDWDEVGRRFGRRPERAAKLKTRWEDHHERMKSLMEHSGSSAEERGQRRRQAWHDGV